MTDLLDGEAEALFYGRVLLRKDLDPSLDHVDWVLFHDIDIIVK